MKSILYEKTYYLPTFIDESRDNRGRKTGKFSGFLFTKTYTITKRKDGNHIVDSNGVRFFSGSNKKEMVRDLRRVIWHKTEFDWEKTKGFPPSLMPALRKFNIV